MKKEIENCKNCGKDFTIRLEDCNFYEQIQIPAPKHCPDCRMAQRLAFRNERTLYKRICDLCKKDGVSLYPQNTAFPVYCHKCWWGDGWDPADYAIPYNPDVPFMEQFRKLMEKVPRVALLSLNSLNSDYTNNSAENKNSYLIFAAENNEDCLYGRLVQRCKSVMDCNVIYDSELCYECVDTRNSFKCLYGERLQECMDVLFSFDMRNCQNCIFCSNGRNLKYCINNKQCTKEEYDKNRIEVLASYESIEKAKEKYKFLKGNAIVKYAQSIKCHNLTGDYVYNCHEGIRVFDSENTKNSSYLGSAEGALDCQDCDNLYFKPERLYNVMSTLQSTKCIACTYIFYCNEVYYSDSCHNCANCFGCIGLNKKNYHILNKEYSKNEYHRIKAKIENQMKKEGTYGELFTPLLSPFGYNETLAQEYFPLTEQEAKEKGFNWQNSASGTYGKETIQEKYMPETIEEVTEDILKEVLVCKDCKKNFRITKSELDFYKRMNIPLPHKDFECRHQDRMKKRNPRKLWHRSCMCELKNHIHGAAKCENEFETSYSPDRPETVYCEQCYQYEVY